MQCVRPGKAALITLITKGFTHLSSWLLVDSDYKFFYVDVGASGATGDAGFHEHPAEGCPKRQPNRIATTGAITLR